VKVRNIPVVLDALVLEGDSDFFTEPIELETTDREGLSCF
jgi:hypothetical protein